ncbi:Zinc finger protein [Rhynchospora pubera]|uniref:Zinc finger protein n=1 Tax=Rhynchospora pubera TaxID=906938 RepID=A0AAV8GKQ8_9POAL|nr:Zinc finger protein [Rhynchospora pubera]
MDHTSQPQPAQASHYAAPPTYYAPPTSAAAVIGPTPNPNPNSDQVVAQVPVSVSVPQAVDASLTSPVGNPVSQYHDAMYTSYYASMSAAAGGVGLPAAYLGSLPAVGPINPVDGRPSKGLAQMPISQQAVYSANTSTSTRIPKKKKNNMRSALRAPTVAQSVYCDLCKVTCNTQEMYNNHVGGQKHNRKIKNITIGDKLIEFVPARSTSPGTQTSGANDNIKKSVFCDICKIMCDTQEVYSIHLSGKNHNKKVQNLAMSDSKSASKEYLEMKRRKVLESGARGDEVKVCQLCNVVCNGPTVFEYHCRGQKHRSMVKKQENSGGLAVGPAAAPTTNDNGQEYVLASSQLKPEPKRKSKSASKEDLEMKKRKVLESGANGDAVKVCELCNVVCNGPMVFESHCSGQKHKSMVKKQETPGVVKAEIAAATS